MLKGAATFKVGMMSCKGSRVGGVMFVLQTMRTSSSRFIVFDYFNNFLMCSSR
jgi:hypothetical protein